MNKRVVLGVIVGLALGSMAAPTWPGAANRSVVAARGATVGPTRVPVLTYHSHRIAGSTYEANDHVALHQDLRTIHAHGFRIVPLLWVVEWVLGRRDGSTLQRSVAITFDDGPNFDYDDLTHPQYGFQRSFYNILRDFQAEFGVSAQPNLHASSFVIASPTARRQLDERHFGGRGWMTDRWWKEAEGSGLIDIYNHSWDHNHPDVTSVCEERQVKGSFDVIDTDAECRCEVLQAAQSIHQQIRPSWPIVFAYPWGQSGPYLREVCFPSFQDRHHALAAFGTSGGYVTRASPRWNLPRFVSSADWRNTDELVRILNGAR